MTPTSYLVRDTDEGDRSSWAELYNGYREFYRLPADDVAVDTTWRWIIARQHGLRGIVAVDALGRVIALANLRLFARPSLGKMGLYLDDLFTAPEARGTGAASALLQRAEEIADQHDANVVRWITAPDNATARRVYDAHATATEWITYDMQPRHAGEHDVLRRT